MSSWFRRDWSGFLWWETRSRRLFFPPRFCNYGRFDRNLQQDFYNIWKVYYLFLSLAELSLSTCHMVGWMNHKACATNNSACLLRSFQSEATTCVHVQAAWCIRLNYLLTMDSRVYVPGSVGLLEWEQHACLRLRWQVPPELGQAFSRGQRLRSGSGRLSKEAVFTPTPHQLSHFWLTVHRFASPFLLLLPPNRVLVAAALPELQGLLHTWAAAGLPQCQTHWILPLDSTIDIMWAA